MNKQAKAILKIGKSTLNAILMIALNPIKIRTIPIIKVALIFISIKFNNRLFIFDTNVGGNLLLEELISANRYGKSVNWEFKGFSLLILFRANSREYRTYPMVKRYIIKY